MRPYNWGFRIVIARISICMQYAMVTTDIAALMNWLFTLGALVGVSRCVCQQHPLHNFAA
jgi:hypothetical protein